MDPNVQVIEARYLDGYWVWRKRPAKCIWLTG